MDDQRSTPPEGTGDSAIVELVKDDSSRKRFLKMVGGTGAASAFAIFVAACGEEQGGPPPAETAPGGGPMFGEGDVGIANYALTLEFLEADLYRKAAASGKLTGPALELGKRFGQHEQAHVDALRKLIQKKGGKPASPPRTTFPLESQQAILDLAATVENLGANAYLGQAAKIKDKEVLAAALSIHTVEGRHAAALNKLTNKSITPEGAFAKPASMDEVLPKVMPFIAR